MDRDDPAYRGQRDYTRLLLNLYDPLVLGPIARFVWRCPTTGLVERYRRHARDRHLDVGPGTGYFLERSGLPAGSRVTILDPNTNVLRHVSRRLRSLDVTAVEADVLKPLPVDGPFDSAALHLVIHCLPKPLARKADAVANVAAVLAPTGVLFGAIGPRGPPAITRGWRGACSAHSTARVASTTSTIRRRGSARSSGPRSSTWRSRRSARPRSSRPRIPGECHPLARSSSADPGRCHPGSHPVM